MVGGYIDSKKILLSIKVNHVKGSVLYPLVVRSSNNMFLFGSSWKRICGACF